MNTSKQILHGELETSLQHAREELASATSELEKQRTLNERLEDDLLQLNEHKPSHKQNGKAKANGTHTPLEDADSDEDFLTTLDLGRKNKQGTDVSVWLNRTRGEVLKSLL